MAVLGFLAAVILSTSAQGSAAGNRYAKEGVEASKAKNWDKAVDNFRKAVEAEPKDKSNEQNLGIALIQRATEFLKKKNYDGAITDLNEAIKLRPTANAHRSRAYAYLGKGDNKNALEDYNEVVKELKGDPEPLERRAYVEMQLQQTDKALADYNELIKLRPKEAKYYNLRAYALQLKENFKGSLADTMKVLQLEPGNAEAKQRKAFLEKRLNFTTPTPTPSGPIANPNARPMPTQSNNPYTAPTPK